MMRLVDLSSLYTDCSSGRSSRSPSDAPAETAWIRHRYWHKYCAMKRKRTDAVKRYGRDSNTCIKPYRKAPFASFRGIRPIDICREPEYSLVDLK